MSSLIALVGNPNSGKTTLFNWLSGSRFRAVNYPGATVDCYIAETQARYGEPLRIIDTPGTYSLFPKSPDEVVTCSALFENRLGEHVRDVILVTDGSQLDRQLYLAKQLQEAGFRTVMALTMTDLLQGSRLTVDTEKLSQRLGIPVVVIDGRLGGGVQKLVEVVRSSVKNGVLPQPQSLPHWDKEKIEKILKESADLAESVVLKLEDSKKASSSNAFIRTRRMDSLLLHPIWGLFFFFGIMSALFSSIFWMAAPAMDWVDSGFSAAADLVLSWGTGELWSDFLANGILLSFGAVLVFVPQIFILFLGISILEDSGYLARAATVIDKPFSWLGLSGRSFVPLLSGFACAVPAMMATRNIRSPKERWLTMFVIPLMSCSARLPVYALLLSFLFMGEAAWKPGLILALIYLGSLVMAAVGALILQKFVKIPDSSMFMLELPVYRLPKTSVILRTALHRTQSYVKRAGPIIFVFALIVWAGTSFPRVGSAPPEITQSYLGQVGQKIEPVFEPMGVDWRVGVGLLSSIAAREIFVSTLALVFNVGNVEDDQGMQDGLLEEMKTARNSEGNLIFTPASIAGLIVFFMLALQCMSTVAMAHREMNSISFAFFQWFSLTALAYIIAVGTVQIFQ